MTLHLHHLTGCAPTPLAHYLKALGVLRIVGEQLDPSARGWWQDEHFCLLTALDRDAVEKFLLEDYEPTAFVSPWNRGSGFYGKTDTALGAVEESVSLRFAAFRAGIAAARAPLAPNLEADAAVRALKGRTKSTSGMSPSQKAAAVALKEDPAFKIELLAAERRFKQLKAGLFAKLLRTWRGGHRAWMDAAVVVLDDDRTSWPSLVGTGGADGRLDFTNNLMLRLGELFDLASAEGRPVSGTADLLRSALWSTASHELAVDAAIGQFLPGSAGGANSTTAPDGASLINPWDFVLMLEGVVPFGARATRRLDPNAMSRASAPFAVRAQRTGYGTRGTEKAGRGEQWMPLWSRPATFQDLKAMLGEARVQLGRYVAGRPLDVARAVARRGVARGVIRFTRFGYLERNGQSNIAVPLGRVDVRARSRSRLVDDLAPWLDRLQRSARDDRASARFVQAEGGLANAVFAALTHDDAPDRWQAVLAEATAVEAAMVTGTAVDVGPIPPLSPEWVAAADDGSPEWRLACSLGSAARECPRNRRSIDPVRHHWLPLEDGARRFRVSDKRLLRDPRVVMTGREPVADFAAIVERRLVEAAQRGQRLLPLVAAPGFESAPSDLAALVAGSLDLDRVSLLVRALMVIRWDRCSDRGAHTAVADGWSDEAFMALRLASLPWGLDDARVIAVDSAIVRRLTAGDGAAAVDLALRRLRAAGLRPPIRGACSHPVTAKLWAAALAFPISHRSARAMAQRFEHVSDKEIR